VSDTAAENDDIFAFLRRFFGIEVSVPLCLIPPPRMMTYFVSVVPSDISGVQIKYRLANITTPTTAPVTATVLRIPCGNSASGIYFLSADCLRMRRKAKNRIAASTSQQSLNESSKPGDIILSAV